jgi:hypothetical protein
MLTRESILAIKPTLRRQVVDVPEWEDGQVCVREMTAAERDRFEVILTENKRSNFRGLLAVFTVCDETGKRLFTEADAPFLASQPAAALERIAVVALPLCKFTDADVEVLAKNSNGDQAEDSSFVWPPSSESRSLRCSTE